MELYILLVTAPHQYTDGRWTPHKFQPLGVEQTSRCLSPLCHRNVRALLMYACMYAYLDICLSAPIALLSMKNLLVIGLMKLCSAFFWKWHERAFRI